MLLIEDERWVRVVVREVLRQTGLPFEIVQECTNGLEALDWLKKHEAQLILADVKMPVMDGISFVEQLCRLDDRPSVIFISGHDDFQAARKAMRFGVVDYLLKPVEVEDMTECLVRWMDKYMKRTAPTEASFSAGIDQPSTIEQVMQIIHESRARDISLTEVAAKVHMNPSYLSQYFKQQTGSRFVDYVVALRMEEAKMLVVRTSLRISEIAERLGYNDIAYFSNTFKKMTGKTPLEFRKTQVSDK
ncbi:response regulator [Paenibacillus sp. sptzw28]|uniref:response regulator transcription factor n=1 Tax=Paenibacillus sp. sptzw28 TaxID=715179 RepID=UPI0021638B78|nr:response regulator [Paenibacillus sp. sptzw28]